MEWILLLLENIKVGFRFFISAQEWKLKLKKNDYPLNFTRRIKTKAIVLSSIKFQEKSL
jgi:hypothetical protein